MAELNFATGVQTFTVNGTCEVSFNPTDTAFVERLYNAFDALGGKQEYYKEESKKIADGRDVFKYAEKIDAEMRNIIDGVFEKPVSADVFGSMSTYSMADGLPLWANFVLSIMDKCDATITHERKLTNPRIAKYTAKYHK